VSTGHKVRRLEEIVVRREQWRAEGRTVALANGIFDLLHVGHVRYLEGARELADHLVVAVNSDASTRAYKGPDRPHIPEAERAEMVAALACTDLVLVFDEPNVRGIIRALKPDVHVKGTDYTPESIPEADEVRAYGGRVAVAGDPKNHSTTELARRLRRERGETG
jgi:D-glycero-beta-D-manno-heptose 1-phosphate adenylyltransferase